MVIGEKELSIKRFILSKTILNLLACPTTQNELELLLDTPERRFDPDSGGMAESV